MYWQERVSGMSGNQLFYFQVFHEFNRFVIFSLDYRHGTGHGIGSYLSVHEAPTLIRQKVDSEDPGMWPGVLVSNGNMYNVIKIIETILKKNISFLL